MDERTKSKIENNGTIVKEGKGIQSLQATQLQPACTYECKTVLFRLKLSFM